MSTEDNSIADINDGVVEILSTNGDVYLGGSDIDKAVSDWVIDEFNKEHSIDLSQDKQAVSRILEAVEKAKIELSSSSSTEINLPYITIKDNAPIHLIMTLTKSTFERLITPIVDKVINCAKGAIKAADIEAKELQGILLVGGSCRIPLVQERLTQEFGVELIKSSNMDLAVAEGAAIQGSIIVGDNSTNDILLLDVTPISMGIETMGGVFTKLVEANTTIPCKKTEIFSTAVDNQTSITISVLQGERPMAKDNKQIGMFHLDGILPAKKGVPQIEVTFDIDSNGILTVTALDKATNKQQHIRIETKGALSQEEIERIKAEAKQFEESDKKEREKADTINKGDSIVYQQEKLMEEQKDNIEQSEKDKLDSLVSDMKTAVKDKNIDEINRLEKEINDVWMTISQRIYNKQQNNESNSNKENFDFTEELNKQAQQNTQHDSNEETVDGDFEEVK